MSALSRSPSSPGRPPVPVPPRNRPDDLGGTATLIEPTRTAEQRAKAEEAQREMDLSASRGVARHSMLRAHGCTGKKCRSEAHAADREVRDDLLCELGLREDPGSYDRWHYGKAAPRGNGT